MSVIELTNPTVGAAERHPRSADRLAAIWIGALFIVGTATLVLSLIVTAGILTGPDVLASVAEAPTRVSVGALLVIVAAAALGLVPVVFWPIGRRHGEILAMGYLVFRGAIETILYLLVALGWLALVALRAEPDAAPLAGLVTTVETVISTQLLGIPFAIGALLFTTLLYRSRLVPRWLSGWGFVGAALYLLAPIASMFGLSLGVLMGPLAVQEMVLALWLIVRGFSPTAIAAGSAEAAAVGPTAPSAAASATATGA